MAPDLDGYEQIQFQGRPVYRRGLLPGRPGVLVTHGFPGMTDECLDFGRCLADAGFAVYLPLLFGTPRRRATFRNLARLCVRREWNLWAAGRSSPIVDELRALTAHIRDETGHPKVAAVGMCLTGGFALVLLLDPWTTGAVVSQPALPLKLPGQNGKKSAVDLSPQDLASVRLRLETEDRTVLGLRFEDDTVCSGERFATLRRELGPRFEDETVAGPGHSVLTRDFATIPEQRRGEIWDRLVSYLGRQLG